jgi:twitching motility protein PilT
MLSSNDGETPAAFLPTNDAAEPVRGLLDYCLQSVVQAGGSDLHLRAGEPPYIRVRGDLNPIDQSRPISPEEMAAIVTLLTERVPGRRDEFAESGETDLSYELAGTARYRVNVFRERGTIAATLRVIPADVPTVDSIGVPPVVADLALEHHGLILVTGATGSGKTTTLAAMIDHINRSHKAHILTIEDPIEIVHSNHSSLVSQREVGADTGDFMQALRRALRQDPDVILIGEIRDEETMRTALAAAETGHLVFATLHTIDATETVHRILDLFPAHAEKQARAMLAGALKGIISQRLAVTVDGGRVPVVEILVNTARTADCIVNPEDTAKLPEAIEEGGFYGMQSFDQALIALILSGRITEDEAMRHVSKPQNFRLTLDSARSQVAADEAAAVAEREAQLAYEAQLAQEAAMAAAAPVPAPLPAPVPGGAPIPAAAPAPGAAPPPQGAAVPPPAAPHTAA